MSTNVPAPDLGLAPEVEKALNKALKAIKFCSSRREDERNFHCALFHGEYIDVTDGHICARLRVTGAKFERALLPIRQVQDARAALAYRCEPDDCGGNFPPFDAILASARKTVGNREKMGVNPEFFARVAKLRKALPGSDGVAFRVAGGELEPIHFSFDSPSTGIEVEGAIMPMRL